MSNFYWLIIKLSIITWLLGLVQVTKLCPFPVWALTGDYPPHSQTCIIHLSCCNKVTLLFCVNMTIFSACRQVSVCWRGPLSGVVFSLLLQYSGSRTQSRAFVGRLSRGLCNFVLLLVSGPSLSPSLACRWPTMLCGRDKGWGSSLFACFAQLFIGGVYLLSSGLSAAVKLFTNCKGTAGPTFLYR